MDKPCEHGDWEVDCEPVDGRDLGAHEPDQIRVHFRCPHCGYEQMNAVDAPLCWWKKPKEE